MKLSVPYDVVIAGGGPVGLFLACELGLAGCSVLIIEQAAVMDAPHKRGPQGLRGLSVASVELLERRGLLTPLKARSRDPGPVNWAQGARRPAGHFAGIPFFFDQIDQQCWPDRMPSDIGPLVAELETIEAVFAERAQVLGVELLRGTALESFEQSGDGVVVRAGDQVYATRWLVGCDGGRSVIRKQGGFGFTGTEPELTGYSMQVVLDDPQALKPGRHYMPQGMVVFTPPATLAIVEYDGGVRHRATELTPASVGEVLRRVCSKTIRLNAVEQGFTWTDRAFLATHYRQGRVFLAGDAAHIHSPLGGQGLNLGLGDAANLGWKLAAALQGQRAPEWLDSYERERRPVAEGVLAWSRAQVALMRPDPGARALMAVMRDVLGTVDGATYAARRVWGVAAQYDMDGQHAIIGRYAPNFALSDGQCLNVVMRDGGWWVLDFVGQAALAAWCGKHVGYATGIPQKHLGLHAVLVRPDGIVAWATTANGETPGDISV